MKVSFICPVRNKVAHIENTMRSILAQTYSPMEIVISDQCSTDGSRKIIDRMASDYDGPNKIRVLTCEDTSYAGMPGLNNHLNFINSQIEGDVVIMCSADDLNHPDRALHTVHAFEEFNPSYVNTGVNYMSAAGEVFNHTNFDGRANRWLKPTETIVYQIGSNGSSAWARDLYQKHAPLVGCEQQDMILPMMALFERGIYYVDRYLHTYITHASPDNTGIFGQIQAAQNATENDQLIEINNFMHVFNWTSMIGRWQADPEMFAKLLADPDAFAALMEKLSYNGHAWAQVRNHLIMNRIAPTVMRV